MNMVLCFYIHPLSLPREKAFIIIPQSSAIHPISNPLPPETVLVSVDVTELYTNILHIHDLVVLQYFIDIRPNPQKPRTYFFFSSEHSSFFHELLLLQKTQLSTHQQHGHEQPYDPFLRQYFMGRLAKHVNSTHFI